MIMGEQAVACGDRAQPGRPWWETRWMIGLVVLGTMVPLLYPPIPPLVDLLGHMGRFRVELDLAHSPWLQRYYDFHWAMIGNLGVDILILPLSKLVGLEGAVKLITLAIPPLTAIGFLWVAREVHGRIPPTAFASLPFIYGFPFLYGFVNYALSIGLAFLAFALWLRLGRLEKTRLRALLFVPVSLLIFFCHVYGWALLVLLCLCAEAVQQHEAGRSWPRAGVDAALPCLVMGLPVLVMLIWHNQSHAGSTEHWFDFSAKIQWVLSALRDRWKWFDIASVIAALILIVEARRRDALSFSRTLVCPALVLSLVFLSLPLVISGSAYADMRFVPYIFALSLLAIRVKDGRTFSHSGMLAAAALLFFALRMASNTASLALASDQQQERLQALDMMPPGARVATLVGEKCGFNWESQRGTHIGAMVIVRRDGFSNDQWLIHGINLMSLKYEAARLFAADPSELVHPKWCRQSMASWSLEEALSALPREAFDFLWLVDTPPPDPRALSGMRAVWRGRRATLYRIPHHDRRVNRL